MRGLIAPIVILVSFLGGANVPAQEAPDPTRSMSFGDWSVFVDDGAGACWIASTPESEDVSGMASPPDYAGPILMATFFLEGQPEPQLSYANGFVFDEGSPITLRIKNLRIDMFSADLWRWAWAADADDDARASAAMRVASSVRLDSQTQTGATVIHSFSLSGYGPALDEAARRCKTQPIG